MCRNTLRICYFGPFLVHSYWEQWMRYMVEQMLTEVVDRGRKLYSVDGSCIVNREGISLACYPSHLVKVKINFDEAQKLKWKEVKCLYGLIKNNNLELLKMQFESRGRNVHTPGGPLVGSFQHMLWPRRRASEAAILVSRTFAFVFSWYKVIIAIWLCFSSGALQYTVHTSIIAAKIVSLKFFFELQYFGPDLRLAWTKTAIPIR